jgi:hypothetical protein
MTEPTSLVEEFARRACIDRASLPPEFGEAPTRSQRPVWEAYFAELGVTAPESFLALLDHERDLVLDFGGWGMLSVKESRYFQTLFTRAPHPLPVDAIYGAMIPLFCRDGDLLLLDRSGAVFAYMHDGDTEPEPAVAPSFESLLRTLLDVLDGRAAYPLDLYARAIARAQRKRV